jgi:hypothetical protein
MRQLLPVSPRIPVETNRNSTEGLVMPGCAGCQRASLPSPAPGLLFHIARRYCAEWNGLALTVQMDSAQMDSAQWTLSVRDDARNETLYTAYRSSQSAARAAAADFAITHLLGFASRMNPQLLAAQLAWQERW